MRLITNKASPRDFPGSDPPEPHVCRPQMAQQRDRFQNGEVLPPLPPTPFLCLPCPCRREKASPALMLQDSLSVPRWLRG